MTWIAKTDKLKKPKDELWISASQIETFDGQCERKWWFEKIAGLPTKKKPYFAFGTCLHECIERWIRSTANGRVPDEGDWDREISEEFLGGQREVTWTSGPFRGQTVGKQTELFPPGFETVTEDDGTSMTLTPNEARQVKKLVVEAIEKGIITKGENVHVEKGFLLPIIEGVKIIGYLDFLELADLPTIKDHKSFGKSSIRYLKQPGPKRENGTLIPIAKPYQDGDGTSPNAVGHVQQNLTYAWAFCEIEGYKGPVLLAHNQFPKFEFDRGVRSVEALVSQKRIEAHGKSLQEIARRMVKVSKIKRWEDTPPPKKVTACSDYGGCDFQEICGRRINPALYSQRTEAYNAEQAGAPRPNFPTERKTPRGQKNMAKEVFKRKKSGEGDSESPAPSSMPKTGAFQRKKGGDEEAKTDKPKKSTAFNGGTKASESSVKNGAPWANSACPACKGLGINSKGAACPICDKTAEKRGVPTSIMYEIEVTDEGYVATARDEHAEAIGEMDAPHKWEYEKGETAAKADAKPSKFGKAKKAAEPEEEEEEQEADEEEEPPAKSSKFQRSKLGKAKAAETEEEQDREADEDGEDEEPAKGKSKFQRRAAAAQEPEEDEEQEADEDAADDDGEAQEEAPVRRGRGRPPGSKNKSTLAREAEESQGGRPRAGITLCMGCAVLAGPKRPVMLAQTLLETLGTEMASDMGADSFYTLDQRKRQDRLKQAGKEIADSLGRTVVVFPGGTNDFDLVALFNCLAPHAELVVEGLK